ncbi:hypothetical protein KEM60_00383 [Austwickia sp. TVS 96-490-7B]|nr:hypothetical protein [Austwickia sp. TVS 96-490-7B]
MKSSSGVDRVLLQRPHRQKKNNYLYASGNTCKRVDPSSVCGDFWEWTGKGTIVGTFIGGVGGALIGGLATGGVGWPLSGLLGGGYGAVAGTFVGAGGWVVTCIADLDFEPARRPRHWIDY